MNINLNQNINLIFNLFVGDVEALFHGFHLYLLHVAIDYGFLGPLIFEVELEDTLLSIDAPYLYHEDISAKEALMKNLYLENNSAKASSVSVFNPLVILSLAATAVAILYLDN